MVNINYHDLLSPVQAGSAKMNPAAKNVSTQTTNPDMFSYDWFVMSGHDTTTYPMSDVQIPPINSINRVDKATVFDGTMESRIERIVQYILPRA